MTKKHFIALADTIKDEMLYDRSHNKTFNDQALEVLADFCARQNPRFMRDRWLGYIRGECGPNGGKRGK